MQISFREKIGYAAGDAAANLVWRGALAYLAVFYTDTFGLSAAAVAILFLVVRLTDGITDIIMGMIADRTRTPWGSYRPWIIWSTPFLGLFMVLSFSAPDLSDSGKLVYAYATYIGLTLFYTINNVPYSALMGVMTSDDMDRTSLSGYRFAGAFGGGLLVMGFLPDLVAYFGQGDDAAGYQMTMYVFAAILMALMVITFVSTKERVVVQVDQHSNLKKELIELSKNLPFIILPLAAMSLFFYYRNIETGLFFVIVIAVMYRLIKQLINRPSKALSQTQQDVVDLLTNKPWLILLGMGFLIMMINGIKSGVIVYYFKYYLANELLVGSYFVALLLVSMAGALSTKFLAKRFGKKNLFMLALAACSILTTAMFWIPQEDVYLVFVLGCSAEFFAAIFPTLFFTMLGDSADYSEWKNGRRATGLVYSAGTFVQKTGGGFAGALVMIVLASYGYDGMDAQSAANALPAMQLLMSWIPAAFALVALALMYFYPVSEQQQAEISQELMQKRSLG